MSNEIKRLTTSVVESTKANFKEAVINFITGDNGFPNENILHLSLIHI